MGGSRRWGGKIGRGGYKRSERGHRQSDLRAARGADTLLLPGRFPPLARRPGPELSQVKGTGWV